MMCDKSFARVGFAARESVHSGLIGVGSISPVLTGRRGSLLARCSSHIRLESFSAPSLAWDVGELDSTLSHSPEEKYRFVDSEGGIEASITGEFSRDGRVRDGRVPISERRPVGDVAEAVGDSGEPAPQQGAAENGDDGSSSTEGAQTSGFFISLEQRKKDVVTGVEVLKEDVISFDINNYIKPGEGVTVGNFAVVAAFLLFIFWLGNYFIPDLVFKDTVFKKEPKDKKNSTVTSSGNTPSVSNQRPPEGSAGMESMDGAEPGKSVAKGFGKVKSRRKKGAVGK